MYKIIFLNAPDAIFLTDPETGIILDANHAASTLLDQPIDEIIGMHHADLHPAHPDEKSWVDLMMLSETKEGATSVPKKNVVIRQDSTEIPVEVTANKVVVEGKPLLLGVFRNITEKYTAEKALIEALSNLNALIDGSPLAIITADPKGRIMTWNPAAERIFGWKAEEVVNRIGPIVLEKGRKEFLDMIKRTLEGEKLLDQEMVRLKKDGTPINVSISTAPVYEQDTPVAVVAMFADITRRKMAEEALMRSDEQYRTVVQTATDAIISADASGKVISWNRVAEELFGYMEKEAIGMEVTELMPPGYREAHNQSMEKLIKTGKEKIIGKTVEVEGLRKNGEQFPVEISLASWKTDVHINFTAIIRDITERKKLEAQIHHSQKLESLGILAGGIAHDFNNLLMGILGNASLALPKVPDENPAHLNIMRIEQAAIRASDLTNQMLAYSGKGKFIVGVLDTNKIVEEMSQLLTSSVGKKCGIYYNLSSDPVTIEGSSAQIQQLIMNLITNASDAIGEDKGTITVTTRIEECDQDCLESAYFAHDLPEGLYSSISVSDSGKGMDRETLEKLFDPFYSTKETGRGLGLAAVLGIVRGHKGIIQVESEPNKGTRFRVLLPYTEPDETISQEEKPPGKITKWRESGTVLVVDDEEYVRDVVTNILEECGLTVILAQDGAEGLEVFAKMGKEIDLVLLDMTMPEMSGREVFAELRNIDKKVKVILSSGYSEQEICAEIIDEHGDVEFIQKPYRAGALVDVARKMLE
ncbi:MAG: PAS domain S-box protein [bacterium]